MNSARDPMFGVGHDMFFDTTGDTMQGDDLFFGNQLADQDSIMDEMFATSPQRSTISSLKDVAHPTQTAIALPESSPDDSSEDSLSDDSARHKRKSSSMSFQTDVDMLDGSKFTARDPTYPQPNRSQQASRHQFPSILDSRMVNEAMANDFDFDSAASSPSPSAVKSPAGSTVAMSEDFAVQPTNALPARQQARTPGTGAQIKTESVTSQSPSISRKMPPSSGSAHKQKASTSSPLPRSQLHIHRIPPKSRVETQIPMKITITPMPEGIEKLHLPTHTISKPKLIARPSPEPSADMLELHSMLVCTSAMQDPSKRERAFRTAAAKTREMEADEKETLPREEAMGQDDPDNPLNGGEVHICRGCITRERKRAARKKSKKPEEEAAWASDEARRVVVFNTTEVRQWEDPEDEPNVDKRGRTSPSFPPGSKQVKMPMRIACYCRHHAEKLGFQVIITLKDHEGHVVGQAISDPIIITDDHKAQPLTAGPVNTDAMAQQMGQWVEGGASAMADSPDAAAFSQLSRNAFSSNDLASLQMTQAPMPMQSSGFSPFASVSMGQSDPKSRNRSRQVSPASSNGHLAKRRKANGGPKVPESLMMTKSSNPSLPNPATPSAASAASASNVGNQSVPTSAISPFGFTFPTTVSQLSSSQQQRTPSFPSGPPTPDSGTNNDFWVNTARAQSFDTNAPSQPMFSAPSSRLQSRAASPAPQAMPSMQNMPQRPSQAYNVAQPQTQPFHRAPVINKIVPGEGPVAGGVEVTCLGSGFFNGLEVVFGNSPATTTTYWGETTLVCLLPPADRPGVVPVTFKHQFENFASAIRTVGKQSFVYVDDEEQDLFRQAFIVLSQKMTGGQAGDPADFARKALGTREGASGWNSYASGSGQYRQMSSASLGKLTEDTEATVMRCLELIDMDESPYPADLDMQRSNGQTLLHLAASLGYQRLVAALLARGADPNLPDRNGFSALHMASLRNHPKIVRRLRFAGADPHMQSRLGYMAAELTTDSLTLHMLDTSPHLRSRSFGSSSFTSRRSSIRSFTLATPPRTRASSVIGYANREDWDSSSDEDEEEDFEPLTLVKTRSWHQSRRNSAVLADAALQPPTVVEPLTAAAAMMAWRDQLAQQIQQFQQSVEGILPHLQMPTLPNIPPLQNYQAPAMVRRFSSLVPQRSSRPSSPTESTGSGKEGDHKWWDFFTGSQPTPSSPPSYSEIYPDGTEQGLDAKARAVASAQARNAKEEEQTLVHVGTSRSTTVVDSLADSDTEHREELRATHARKVKGLSNDKNLQYFWMPLLLVLIAIYFGSTISSWLPWRTNVDETQTRAIEV